VDNFGNVFSQFGEDKILAELLKLLEKENELDKWACEFGAWDGLHFSNTANLIVNSHYTAVLIESDKTKFKQLKTNMSGYPAVLVNNFVTLEGSTTIDNILSKTSIPINFDLLSIDIDGADYWILEGLTKYRPKIVVIEFNPTIPKEIRFINSKNIASNQGSSMKSVCELAESKDYKIAGITTCNIILIDSKYADIFSERIIKLEDLPDPLMINRIWQTFDGKIHTENPLNLLWHDISVSNSDVQVLPKIFRIFPGNMGGVRLKFLALWKKFKSRKKTHE